MFTSRGKVVRPFGAGSTVPKVARARRSAAGWRKARRTRRRTRARSSQANFSIQCRGIFSVARGLRRRETLLPRRGAGRRERGCSDEAGHRSPGLADRQRAPRRRPLHRRANEGDVARRRATRNYSRLERPDPEGVRAARRTFAGLLPTEHIRAWRAPEFGSWAEPSERWRNRAAELAREYFLANLGADAVHVSAVFEGFFPDAMTSIGLLGRQPPVGTIFMI